MTKRTKNTKSLSFLLEYLFVLFFFAISAMICIQIYTKSITINTTANVEKMALEYAQEAIEHQVFQQSAYQYLDYGGKMVDEADAIYTLSCHKESNDFSHYRVDVNYKDKAILSLPFYQEGDIVYE